MTDAMRLVVRDDAKEWERVVFAEVLIPETPNTFGDYWTKDAIKEAAYLFAKHGYGIDIEHDNVDRTGDIYVVESFIAREGDPVFIPGSWVIGMKIEDSQVWQDVLDEKINGYSYEAIVAFLDSTLRMPDIEQVTGVTEPDHEDGHTHEFFALLDENGRVVGGGTSDTNGHSHQIKESTVTEKSDDHKHRYTIIKGTPL